MDTLQPYILPLKGLGTGSHQFTFAVDSDFFAAFPDSPVQQAEVQLTLDLDKRPNLLVLDFSYNGWVEEKCDRCLTQIQLSVEGANQLLVKFGEPEEENEDEDVVYIPAETAVWSVAQFAYEYILLGIPMIKACEEVSDTCDQEMLSILEGNDNSEEERHNPLRDALKNWKQPDN
ncbi:MAG: DUF177 domain-containing protein [Bacteroidota bacterium]